MTLGGVRQGEIAWARVADDRGFVKRRPVIVVGSPESIANESAIGVVAVTTSFPHPPPTGIVELPWDPLGRASTGLRSRSAAVCTWYRELAASDLEATGRHVPRRHLRMILEHLKTQLD